MAADILQNQSDANQRVVEIYLEDNAGNGYTGSTSGFTIVYRKPGSGSDSTKTLIAQGGDGRFVMQLSSGDVDTAGAGWVKVVDPGNTIIPFIDGVRVVGEDTDLVAALANIVTSLSNEGTLSTAITALAAQATDIQNRIPNTLVGGNMKANVQAYASGQVPLQPLVAGRTLQVTAAGRTGIDWANVENPSSTVGLSGTTVGVVTALATAAYNAVRDAILAGVVDATGGTPRTVKGVLYRANAFMKGKAAGLLASLATFYAEDGTTKAMEFTQDTGAGTRVAASTVTGD